MNPTTTNPTTMNPANPMDSANPMDLGVDTVSVLSVSTVELSLRMGLALALIVTMITAGTALAKKRGSRTKHAPVTIRHQQQLTKHTTLTLLTAGQQHLLIATNNQTTTLLAQGPTLTTTPTPATNPATTPTPTPAPAGGTHTNNTHIDIRTPTTTPTPSSNTSKPKTLNPLKQLQNKTVRRA